MSAPRYVICAAFPHDADDEPLFWSNDDGWGSLTNANVFTEPETKILPLPSGALDWVQLPNMEIDS